MNSSTNTSRCYVENSTIAVARARIERRLALRASLALLITVGGARSAATAIGAEAKVVRIATFNVSLYGDAKGVVAARLQDGNDQKAQHLAEIIQRVRPDILLLNEIDYEPDHRTLKLFRDAYLSVAQHASASPDGPADPIVYPHFYAAATNTGQPSGFDLDNDGSIGVKPSDRTYGADCWGYGVYPGQYGMAILSRLPIDASMVRTFREFLWKDMPGAQLPDDSSTDAPGDWYSEEELNGFRLSSNSHWDVPIEIGAARLHLLASHPTPPTFDGAEDRNGRRNHDEIRFWADYIGPSNRSAYIYDDLGHRGGLGEDENFIILGDLNGDPHDGQGSAGIVGLLKSPRLLKYAPAASRGAVEQAKVQGGVNSQHRDKPQHDTLDAADGNRGSRNRGPGNWRVDYLLPSVNLSVVTSGVFWPISEKTHFFP